VSKDLSVGYDNNAVTRSHLSALGISYNLANQIFSLRRWLHPILKQLNWKHLENGRTTTGAHTFRRLRGTYLKNYTSTPPGIINFWLGWAGEECRTFTIKSGMTWRFAKRLRKKRAWASSFRQKNRCWTEWTEN
jgi:hypothetical protein